jgi:hypothetical protein
MLDVALWIAVLAFALGCCAPNLLNLGNNEKANDQIMEIILLPFAMILDALIYTAFGNTPGKWLSGIAVRNSSGGTLSLAKYLGRNFGVYFSGLAIGIPIVPLFTLLANHRKVKAGHQTSWDEYKDFGVYRVRGSTLRTTLTAFTYLLLVISFVALGEVANNTSDQQLAEIANTILSNGQKVSH